MDSTQKPRKTEYIHRPTRNPYVVARACLRLVKDLGATQEATIIESQFMRSRWLKKYAGWQRAADRLMPGKYTLDDLDSLPRLPIFILLLAIMLLNTALYSQDKTGERFDAISEGWHAGKRAKPLYGIDWAETWHRPIAELRQELDLPETTQAGIGILEEAV